ncbi:MAG: hypothetical protein M3Z08_09195 [Chloroflexota bacterium]|nr:hypothetical protein [Chloroflexota bacterium]
MESSTLSMLRQARSVGSISYQEPILLQVLLFPRESCMSAPLLVSWWRSMQKQVPCSGAIKPVV